jgi:hypothetical protein
MQRRQVKRSLLWAINDIFRSLESGDGVHREEIVSVKKLREGDGT